MLKHIDQYIASKTSKKKASKTDKSRELLPPPSRTSRKTTECILVDADQMIDDLFAEIRKDREQWIRNTFEFSKETTMTSPYIMSFMGDPGDTSRLEAINFLTDSPKSEK